MKSNGNGIYKDKRTGHFVARLVDAYGKRRSKAHPKLKDAQQWLNQQRAARDAVVLGFAPPTLQERPRVLFGQYARDWHARVNTDVAPSTRKRYDEHIEWIATGALADVPIDELTFQHVEAWLAAIAAETVRIPIKDEEGAIARHEVRPRYGYHSVKGMFDLLRRITKRMKVEHGLPLWVCETVQIPKTVRKRKNGKRAALTAAELGAFLRALDDEWFRRKGWRAIFWTMAATGARPCEVLALQWRHIDFEAKTLTLEQTTYQGQHKDGTKTGDPRQPAIPDELAAVLREHRRRFPGVGDALVFPATRIRTGDREVPGPRWESSLKKPFARALTAAGIDKPRLSPYSLRNTFNSLAEQTDRSGIVLRDTMGHSDAAMTERYKNTTVDERLALQAEVIAMALSGSGNEMATG